MCTPTLPAHSCANTSAQFASDVIDLTELHDIVETENTTQVLNGAQRNTLHSNQWLEDTLIDLGQKMLQKQFQNIGGFQSVVLAEKFALIPQLGEFILVLNVSNNHCYEWFHAGCVRVTRAYLQNPDLVWSC